MCRGGLEAEMFPDREVVGVGGPGGVSSVNNACLVTAGQMRS